MKYRKSLTNEPINNRFDNPFELVNYAIDIAKDMVHGGRQLHINPDVNNQAFQILEEISEGKDLLEPVRAREEEMVTIQKQESSE